MRLHLLGLVLMAGTAIPASAQEGRVERRVDKLEQEMRAVQRRVFQNGAPVQPEIDNRVAPSTVSGVPATSAVADLTARVDALESQLATMTGQIEENSNRLRLLEQALNRARQEAGSRLDALERAAVPAPEPGLTPLEPRPGTARTPAATEPAPVPPPTGTKADPAEEAYNAGFRLWEQKRYAEAQKALEAMAKKYPSHRLASWANNLAGRAYLDEGKPATAAKVLLANYQANPRGERAADSLFFLGQALVKLQKLPEACKVYDELEDVYGASMRDFLRQRLPAARTEARCR